MKSKKKKNTAAIKLRVKAEAVYKSKKRSPAVKQKSAPADRMLHELQIHQIELEMQNDELKKANRAAEIAGKKYADLYDFSTVGYFTIDREGNIFGLNLSGAALLGVDRSNLTGKNFRQFLSHESRLDFNVFIGEVYEGREKVSCELVLVKNNGTRLNVYVEGSFVDGSDACSLNVIDITKRKLDEEKIAVLLEKLKRSNKLLEEFSYTVAHDLQAPLRSISGFIGLLEKINPEIRDAVTKDYMDNIKAAAEKMGVLIKDLLAFATVTKESKPLEYVDLNYVVDSIFLSMGTGREAEGKTGSYRRGKLPRVRAAGMHMNQLFQNLIGNAVKFTAPGVVPEVVVEASERDDMYVISVRDNGIGVDEKNFKRIFGAFQKLNPDSEYHGSGIGLATCEKIVELYGGRIWIESAPGKGSTIYFELKINNPN